MCFPVCEWFIATPQNQELCPFYSHTEAGVEYTRKLTFIFVIENLNFSMKHKVQWMKRLTLDVWLFSYGMEHKIYFYKLFATNYLNTGMIIWV